MDRPTPFLPTPDSQLLEGSTIRRIQLPSTSYNEFNTVNSQSYKIAYNVQTGEVAASQSGTVQTGRSSETRSFEPTATLGGRATTVVR